MNINLNRRFSIQIKPNSFLARQLKFSPFTHWWIGNYHWIAGAWFFSIFIVCNMRAGA